MSKKILFINIISHPIYGGTSTVIDNICTQCQGKIILLTQSYNHNNKQLIKNFKQVDKQKPYKIIRLPLIRSFNKKYYKFKTLHYLHEFFIALRLSGYVLILLITGQINKICIGELTYNGYLILLAKLFFIPNVIYIHGEELSTRSNSFLQKLRKIWLVLANKIIVVSKFTMYQAIENYNINPKKIILNYSSVDRNKISSFPRNTESNHCTFLSYGRLSTRKGHINLLQAFKEHLKSHKKDRLIIIGNGETKKSLLDFSNTNHLQSHISFINHCADEELIKYFAIADVYIQTNMKGNDGDNEGYGLTYLEASANGLPVISGNTGGVIEAVDHNITGFNCHSNDINSIKYYMQLLANDKNLRHTLANAGIKKSQTITWQNVTDVFIKSFNKDYYNTDYAKDLNYSFNNLLNINNIVSIIYNQNANLQEIEKVILYNLTNSSNIFWILFFDYNSLNNLADKDIKIINSLIKKANIHLGIIGDDILCPPQIDYELQHLRLDYFIPNSIFITKIKTMQKVVFKKFKLSPIAYISLHGLISKKMFCILKENKITIDCSRIKSSNLNIAQKLFSSSFPKISYYSPLAKDNNLHKSKAKQKKSGQEVQEVININELPISKRITYAQLKNLQEIILHSDNNKKYFHINIS